MAKAPTQKEKEKIAEEEAPPSMANEGADGAENEEELSLSESDEINTDDDSDEDSAGALKSQIEALRKSEELQRTRAERYREEAERAQKLAEERQLESVRARNDSIQTQHDAVATAIAAAQAEVASAKKDMQDAINSGDAEAQAEALDRMTLARANILRLEEGKVELEARIKSSETESKNTNQGNQLPARIQRWLAKHPEFVTDPRKNDKIRSLHWDIIEEGYEFDSDEYIESMEMKLGLKQDESSQPNIESHPKRASIVSAPANRELPSSANSPRDQSRIRLTPQQVEAAKVAGVSEKVYMENLLRINKMKANGTYGGQ